MGAFLVLNVVLDAMQQILSFETSTFRDKVVGGTKRVILSAVRGLRGIRPFETPEFASRLKLAVEAVPSIDYFGKLLNDVLIGLLTVVPLVALTATLAWWVPLLMVAAIAPSMYVQQQIADREWSLTRTQAEAAKRMHSHERMLGGLEYAKETRLLGIGGLLLGRWQGMFDGAMREVLRLRARGRRTVLRYAGAQEDAVRGVSFSVPHGRSVALVGANGSGKTTLVKLACRLYDPDEGTVRWNGRPLPEISVDAWRASVSALMQDHCRFPVSAFDNVWFGNAAAPADDLDGVRAAARQSGIGERIERLPERGGRRCPRSSPAGRTCRAGSGSGWRWRVLSTGRRLRSWCWTSPPTGWTRPRRGTSGSACGPGSRAARR